MLGFYGSTPAYRPVLDLHGWGELQVALNQLSKSGRWAEMPDLVTEEHARQPSPCGAAPPWRPTLRPPLCRQVADRVGFYLPYGHEPAYVAARSSTDGHG
jgi:hypothetical protein